MSLTSSRHPLLTPPLPLSPRTFSIPLLGIDSMSSLAPSGGVDTDNTTRTGGGASPDADMPAYEVRDIPSFFVLWSSSSHPMT